MTKMGAPNKSDREVSYSWLNICQNSWQQSHPHWKWIPLLVEKCNQTVPKPLETSHFVPERPHRPICVLPSPLALSTSKVRASHSRPHGSIHGTLDQASCWYSTPACCCTRSHMMLLSTETSKQHPMMSLSGSPFESCEDDWLRCNCHAWSPVLGLSCLQKNHQNPQQCYDTHPPDDILAKGHSSKNRGRHSLDALPIPIIQWLKSMSNLGLLFRSFKLHQLIRASTFHDSATRRRDTERRERCLLWHHDAPFRKLKLESYSYGCYQISLRQHTEYGFSLHFLRWGW